MLLLLQLFICFVLVISIIIIVVVCCCSSSITHVDVVHQEPACCNVAVVIHCHGLELTSQTVFPALSRCWTGATVLFVCLFVGCLTSQQHASVSQGRICSHNFTCCHTEIEAADPTFHPTQSQYTDTGPTSPSADPITPGAWQGSHWSANIEVTGMTRPRKNSGASGIRTRDLPLSRRTP